MKRFEISCLIFFHRLVIGYIGADIYLASLRGDYVMVAQLRNEKNLWESSLVLLYIRRYRPLFS